MLIISFHFDSNSIHYKSKIKIVIDIIIIMASSKLKESNDFAQQKRALFSHADPTLAIK
jgi:hypothetical protein